MLFQPFCLYLFSLKDSVIVVFQGRLHRINMQHSARPTPSTSFRSCPTSTFWETNVSSLGRYTAHHQAHIIILVSFRGKTPLNLNTIKNGRTVDEVVSNASFTGCFLSILHGRIFLSITAITRGSGGYQRQPPVCSSACAYRSKHASQGYSRKRGIVRANLPVAPLLLGPRCKFGVAQPNCDYL